MTGDDAGTFPPAGSGPIPVPGLRRPPTRLERWQVRREQWRAWRHSRPFWGGLLLILAGLEMFALPLSGDLIHGAIKLVIYIGIAGVFGVLIGALLIVAGLVAWFNQTNKTFYGIAGVVLGIVSFPTSNLGGLIIGMLMAIVGGALVFAWTPIEPDTDAVSSSGAGKAALS
jgi:HAMP domain-containing protein